MLVMQDNLDAEGNCVVLVLCAGPLAARQDAYRPAA